MTSFWVGQPPSLTPAQGVCGGKRQHILCLIYLKENSCHLERHKNINLFKFIRPYLQYPNKNPIIFAPIIAFCQNQGCGIKLIILSSTCHFLAFEGLKTGFWIFLRQNFWISFYHFQNISGKNRRYCKNRTNSGPIPEEISRLNAALGIKWPNHITTT